MIYDYIILGGGASGLSLAHRMSQHPFFDTKSILVLDKVKKDSNDRTWCFWETEDGPYEKIIHKRWDTLLFHSPDLSKSLDIAPYTYKMIRGIDFYKHVYGELKEAKNITIRTDKIESLEDSGESVTVKGQVNSYQGKHVFKSYPSAIVDKDRFQYVDQHFKGYYIETTTDAFNPDEATFMDFRIQQEGESRFFYLLPVMKRKALVEVAIFSNSLLEREDYDHILKEYIDTYINVPYRIEEEEYGVIPMTTYPFFKHNTSRITHIGTGGGIVKPSSGYAFKRIQQHTDQLVDCIINDRSFNESYKGLTGRHLFFDNIMLSAMLDGGVEGTELFTSLFAKLKAREVFKFLNHETTLMEELKIFTAPPFWPFVKALIRERGYLFKGI